MSERPRSRLKDIAEETGYSINTVSLALRDSPRVSDVTRGQILEVAQKLQYVPNQVARSLVERRTRTIGVVLTDVMNPVLTEVAQYVERDVTALDYTMILVTTNHSLDAERRALEALRTRQVDGLLIFPTSHRHLEHIEPLRAANYPVVLLAGQPSLPLDLVAVNNEAGAHKAVSHLIGLGHSDIAFLNGGTRIGNDDKLRGYLRALEQAGIKPDRTRVVTTEGFGYAHGYEAARSLFEGSAPPTALFASTDHLALGAMHWCRENAVAVPHELAVVGFDDTEAARFCDPPLTSVAYDARRVASEAVRRLLALIERGDEPLTSTPIERMVIEPNMTVRATCGAR